jgi:flagellar basal body-associated protein FliL
MERTEHSQYRSPAQYAAKSNKNKIIIAIVAAVIVIGIGGVVAWMLKPSTSTNSAQSVIETSKYQAVFFTNGQVYFGKLSTLNNDYFKLTNIFYLQSSSTDTTDTSKNPQATSTDQNANVQLIKLGSEIHGPEDEMVISRSQVLFFENLKANGKVAKSISQYQNPNK